MAFPRFSSAVSPDMVSIYQELLLDFIFPFSSEKRM